MRVKKQLSTSGIVVLLVVLFFYVGFFLGWPADPLHSGNGRCGKTPWKAFTSFLTSSFSLIVTISSGWLLKRMCCYGQQCLRMEFPQQLYFETLNNVHLHGTSPLYRLYIKAKKIEMQSYNAPIGLYGCMLPALNVCFKHRFAETKNSNQLITLPEDILL